MKYYKYESGHIIYIINELNGYMCVFDTDDIDYIKDYI